MAQSWKGRAGKAFLVDWFKSVSLKPLMVKAYLDSDGKAIAHFSPRYRIVKNGKPLDTPVVEVKRRSKPKPGYVCGSICI